MIYRKFLLQAGGGELQRLLLSSYFFDESWQRVFKITTTEIIFYSLGSGVSTGGVFFLLLPMGVKGLINFLRQKAPEAFSIATVQDIKGKRIGIDISITLYRGAALSYKNGPFSHLETLTQEAAWLLELGCTPIYVFDGDAPAQKEEESRKREKLRAETERRLREAEKELDKNPGDTAALETVEKLKKQCFRITSQSREDARNLLVSMGVRVAHAQGEAERSLAHMQRSGYIDLIFTEDVDVLVCGAASYVKNSSCLQWTGPQDPSFTRKAEIVSMDPVLAGLGVSYEGFLLIAIFSGCDFAPKMARMGPATSWKHVKQHGDTLDMCFDALKTEEERSLRERYVSALPLLRFDKTDPGARVVKAPEPPPSFSPAVLEDFYKKLREEAGSRSSLARLRCNVGRCMRALIPDPPSFDQAGLPMKKRRVEHDETVG